VPDDDVSSFTGPREFMHDVKETFKCYRKYHSYDHIKAHELMDLSYEMEEEFDRLYQTMVEALFLNPTPTTTTSSSSSSGGSGGGEGGEEAEEEATAQEATFVPCSSVADRQVWRALVLKVAKIHSLEELTAGEKLLLCVWLKDTLEQSSSVVGSFFVYVTALLNGSIDSCVSHVRHLPPPPFPPLF